VRGFTRAEYHADIYDEVEEPLRIMGLDAQCLGGGRIKHDKANKYIKVYGYSMGYGKANHERTVDELKKKYPAYKIEWSDEGY
jgi:phosphohistidine phosphatase